MMPLSMVYKMEEANAENALCKQVIHSSITILRWVYLMYNIHLIQK